MSALIRAMPCALVLTCALACDEPVVLESVLHEEVSLPAAHAAPPAAPVLTRAVHLPEPAAVVQAPEPEPEPPPDPEAIARAREEAARLELERRFPWHGIAYHFLAQVHRRADSRSPVMGYMRRGALLRAQPGLRGHGCARGWSRVPGGGFVCRGRGFQLGETPQRFSPVPVPAALDSALPYAYARVSRNDVPQFWHLPTRDEERAAREWIERQRDAERAAEAASEAPAEESAPEPELEAPPGLEDGAVGDEEGEAAASDPAEDAQPSYLRMRMRRGFYVSIDRLETDGGRRFYRTIRGAYVPADSVSEADPTSMRGVVLGGRWALPLGFVYRGGVRQLRREPSRGVLELAGRFDRFTALPLAAEEIVRRSRRYRMSDRGEIVAEDALRIARPVERPPEVEAGDRWIHVDLSEQVLVAYDGERPAFATLVSTGREGHETPTGLFRIQSKHVSTTMDDPDAGEESYSIEDVPWTMYFQDSYALHAAFWHGHFGTERSHGCVNLAPADARWVFQFSGPELPPSMHGMSADRGHPGTWVYVTE